MGSRLCDAPPFQFLADVAIVQTRLEGSCQTIGHTCNKEAVLPVLLETALSVTVFAFLIAYHPGLTRRYLYHPNTENQILGLHAIGTDILYSRSTHVARNQREVLHTIVSGFEACGYHIIPHLSAAAGHSLTRIVFLEVMPLDARAHHDAIKVFRQQEVAASTYYYIRCIRFTQNLCHLDGFIIILKLYESAALGINAKCIMFLQIIVLDISHFYSLFSHLSLLTSNTYVVIFISSHLPPTFLKRSSTSSPLATPRIRKIFLLPSALCLP